MSIDEAVNIISHRLQDDDNLGHDALDTLVIALNLYIKNMNVMEFEDMEKQIDKLSPPEEDDGC